MAARVSKLDSVLIPSGLVVFAGLAIYEVQRLVKGRIGKSTHLAENAIAAGAFLGLSLANVLLVALLIRRRETTGTLRLLIVAILVIAGLIDIFVLYKTVHDNQPVTI